MLAATFSLTDITGDKLFDVKLFDPNYLFDQGAKFILGIYHFFARSGNIGIYHTVLSVLCVFFIFIIAYSIVRLFEIRAKEHKHLKHELEEYAEHHKEETKFSGAGGQENAAWRQVLSHLLSTNPSDWKLAVIEADSMLDALMSELGFKGANLGEKLKSADQERFKDLTAAWEVHTLRNKIAHEGASFELSSHEARRAIATYEDIFRRFGYI